MGVLDRDGEGESTEWDPTEPARRLDPLYSTDPQYIGSYRLLFRLPGGASGASTFLAATHDGEKVVVKALPLQSAPQASARFEREAKNAARVKSPRVAKILEYSQDVRHKYIAMEYVRGVPLTDYEAAQGAGPEDARRLVVGLLRAVRDMHRFGVIHRDIKPANVIVGSQISLVDFGLARTYEDDDITLDGMVAGTWRYMSPEQMQGHRATEASDVYATGVTLVKALTGQHPYVSVDGPGPADLLSAIRARRYDLSHVPLPYRSFLSKALDPDPQNRPTAAQALQEIESATQVMPASAEQTAVFPAPKGYLFDLGSLASALDLLRYRGSVIKSSFANTTHGLLIGLCLAVFMGGGVGIFLAVLWTAVLR